MKSSYTYLLINRADGILWVEINRPEKRNALSLDVLAEIRRAFTEYAEDDSLQAAVLSGAGDKSFAAGGDLKELDAVRSLAATEAMSDNARAALDAIRSFPVPVVAMLNGTALGGGAELAMSCDFRVASANAKIGFVQGTLNITTAWGGGLDLMERIGSAPALRLLMTAEVLSAAQALRFGVVDSVAGEDEALAEAVRTYLQPMLKRTPKTLRAMKALRCQARKNLQQTMAQLERDNFVQCWIDEAHWQAASAILKGKNNG